MFEFYSRSFRSSSKTVGLSGQLFLDTTHWSLKNACTCFKIYPSFKHLHIQLILIIITKYEKPFVHTHSWMVYIRPFLIIQVFVILLVMLCFVQNVERVVLECYRSVLIGAIQAFELKVIVRRWEEYQRLSLWWQIFRYDDSMKLEENKRKQTVWSKQIVFIHLTEKLLDRRA